MRMTPATVRRALLAAGALLAVYAAGSWWHGERVFARMRPTTCTLVVKSVESRLLVRQSPRRRFDLTGKHARLRYRDEGRLMFAHTVDGRKYTFREDVNGDRLPLADYEEGNAYPCQYDPQDPAHATILAAFDREAVHSMLILAGLLVFLGVMTPQIWQQAAAGYAKMRGR